MKKLMLGVAVAFAALGLQAATVTWSLTNVYDPSGAALVGNTYKAYLMTTATVALDAWSSYTTPAAVQAAAEKGYEMTWGAAGKYSNTTYTDLTTINAASDLGLTGGTAYTFYTVVVDAAGENYYVSSTKDLTLSSGTDNSAISMGSQKNYTQAGGSAYVGWTSVGDVPEPTSGLLLLLGVAGLALKRKVA